MEQYIAKSAVVAEIERMKDEYLKHCKNKSHAAWSCGTLDNLLRFIDTIELKEVDLDISKEVDVWVKANGDTNGFFSVQELAKHFFELGLKAQKGE